jgi:hypothetical protein
MLEDPSQPRSPVTSTPLEQLWIELPLPQLLDTSVLFKELHGLAKGHQPRLLSAARSGTAILYVPRNVAEEVPAKLDRIASAAQVPVESVETAWWDDYGPHIRVVDAVPALTDERRRGLSDEDADDLPFADAVALMGPILAFSEDTHLTSRGLASKGWREVPGLTQTLSGVDATLRITPELTALVIGEAAKLARRYPQLAAAILLLSALVFGPLGPERVRLSANRAKAIGLHLLRGLIYILQTRNEASGKIAARLVRGSGNGAQRAVVFALARRREPVALEVLAAELGTSVDPDELPLILSSCPALVETTEGWQLGRPVTSQEDADRLRTGAAHRQRGHWPASSSRLPLGPCPESRARQ